MQSVPSSYVLALYNRLKERGIAVWIDGGWGVDALLGEQTRAHADLDIAVHRDHNARLRRLLESEGYTEEMRDDSSEFMYVMKSPDGECVDIHAFAYDENGGNLYGVAYPFGSLTGTGAIDGQAVNCTAPAFMLQFKTWYTPREKDLHDIRALCAKFGFAVPEGYAP